MSHQASVVSRPADAISRTLKTKDWNNFPAIERMTQYVLTLRDAHYRRKIFRATSFAEREFVPFSTPSLFARSPRTPRQMGDSRNSFLRCTFCTTRAAVTSPVLDKRFSSRAECVWRRKIFREVFHTTKNYVLVCRLISFRNFLLSRATAPNQTGRSALIRISSDRILTVGSNQPPGPR